MLTDLGFALNALKNPLKRVRDPKCCLRCVSKGSKVAEWISRSLKGGEIK